MDTNDATLDLDDDFEIDYENLTVEQEQGLISNLKTKIRNMVLARNLYSGIGRPKYLAVYALLELAAEVSWDGNKGEPDISLFDEASLEVSDVFRNNPDRILNYDLLPNVKVS